VFIHGPNVELCRLIRSAYHLGFESGGLQQMETAENETGLIAEYSWSPPQFNTNRPSLETSLEFQPDPEFPENFARVIEWYV
jgi:hypothetical protein